MADPHTDLLWMHRALRAAVEGQGYVEPNPMVGCVLVNGETMIGSGFHARFGGPHAEVAAIFDARKRGNAQLLAGATAYVTLEPCCHHGKTPPCTEALLSAKVQRVVIAMQDPFPQVQGQGVALLRQHGLQVDVGVGRAEAEELNAPYVKRVQLGLPWIIAKWAMSLDGKIATRSGHSQWISCAESRREVHRLRARVDAVLVGSGTALTDDPLLTAREVPVARTALRVVIDSRLRLSSSSQLASTAHQIPVLIWTSSQADTAHVRALRQRGMEVLICDQSDRQKRLQELLRFLVREKQVTNLLVEGGAELLGAMLDDRLVDQCEVFLAPKLIGGANALTAVAGAGAESVGDSLVLHSMVVEARGTDLHISGRTHSPTAEAQLNLSH